LITDKIQTEILNLREILKKRLPEETKNRIAFFHPDKYMSSLSISENIVFGNVNPQRKRAKGAINDLLKDVVRKSGIEELIIKVGLEFNIGERGSKLSGGQKQKIAIARIMLKNPSILILDEATAALDAVSQTHITKLIEEKCINKTVLSIAHRLNSIKDYDQIIVFDKGYIVQKGNFEELMQQDGLFKKLFEGSN
jgi:putative ABC transport system ATP-binding protein